MLDSLLNSFVQVRFEISQKPWNTLAQNTFSIRATKRDVQIFMNFEAQYSSKVSNMTILLTLYTQV